MSNYLYRHIQFLSKNWKISGPINLMAGRNVFPNQNLDLGPGYFVMLYRKFTKVFFSLFLMFYVIEIKPGPKSRF